MPGRLLLQSNLPLQLLTGQVPDMGQVIASKVAGVAFSNTSLVQCDRTHLAAFNDGDVDPSTQASDLILEKCLQNNTSHDMSNLVVTEAQLAWTIFKKLLHQLASKLLLSECTYGVASC